MWENFFPESGRVMWTSPKRATHWVGFKVHVTETCDPEQPRLITQVVTTAATTPDSTMGPTLQQELTARDLLPSIHLLDAGYVDADLIVTARQKHQVDVVGQCLVPIVGRRGKRKAMPCKRSCWTGPRNARAARRATRV